MKHIPNVIEILKTIGYYLTGQEMDPTFTPLDI